MKNTNSVKISRITHNICSDQSEDTYAVFWIKDAVPVIEINQIKYADISNAVFFLHPDLKWKIFSQESAVSSGYILYLPKPLLDNPVFKKLHINDVRLFRSHEIPKINLAPGIEKRIQSILEMLDELVSTNLRHKEEAIVSLLNTFFIYCDGKCNIKSVVEEKNAKANVVYKFKKILNQRVTEYHRVGEYAQLLHISDKYLNECVKEILGVTAKSLISEQLIMHSRHELKFTDKSIKEICFELGFTSPDYFSTFFYRHAGITPTQLRKE